MEKQLSIYMVGKALNFILVLCNLVLKNFDGLISIVRYMSEWQMLIFENSLLGSFFGGWVWVGERERERERGDDTVYMNVSIS